MRENPKTKAKEYKVHWLGWNKPTWEHEDNVANAKRKVKEFITRNKLKRNKKKNKKSE